jgi:hypothetical protein
MLKCRLDDAADRAAAGPADDVAVPVTAATTTIAANTPSERRAIDR